MAYSKMLKKPLNLNYFAELKKKILNKKSRIGIIGLGYVGLPLAILFSSKGYDVTGLDIDKTKIKNIKNGNSYINHISNNDINKILKKKFLPTYDFSEISKLDIIILCLPTPLKKNLTPDLSHIIKTMKYIDKFLNKGQLIILESSTYPGSTNEIIYKKFIQKKFFIGRDFFIGYSPEREDPSNKKFNLQNIPKLCSGITDNCAKVTKSIYDRIVKRTVLLKNVETAEFTKIYENIYRTVNIALANEMKFLCKKLNLDIFEIINAAKTKPFGFQAFYPGPGVGGHCIPIDPYYLSWVAQKNNIDLNFVKIAGNINRKMPKWVIKNSLVKFKNIKKLKILLIGVAYKRNVDDVRESPSLDFLNIFHKMKIECDYYDPYVKILKSRKLNKVYKSKKISSKMLKKYHLTYILTDHDNINFKLIKDNSRNIIDTRNRFKSYSKNVIKL
tara:strand:+ start:180 stop:1511 length:1332 start_codon:yes stop_codon:yes gene_type:complete